MSTTVIMRGEVDTPPAVEVKRPNGLAIWGHSYVGYTIPETGGPNLGENLGRRVPEGSTAETNAERGFTHMLRRRYGLASCWYRLPVDGVGSSTADKATGLISPQFRGSLHSVYYAPLLAVTGDSSGGNYRKLEIRNSYFYLFNGNTAELDLITGVNLSAGRPTLIPLTLTPGADWLQEDWMIGWYSTYVGGGTARNDGWGGELVVHINGGDFSNYGMAGACLVSADVQQGGVGEMDNRLTFIALQGEVWGTVASLDSNNKIDTSIARSGLPIHVFGFNDMHKFNEESAWKETVRFAFSAQRWMARYISGHVTPQTAFTITEVAGNMGGAWTSRTPAYGYAGLVRDFAGTPGTTTKSTITYAVPANYNGEPIDLLFYTEPCRDRTVTKSISSPNIGIPSGVTADDVGRSISGTGIPAGTTITSVNTGADTAVMSANATDGTTVTATIGRGGGEATLKIKVGAGSFATPDFAGGVRINGGTDDTIITDHVCELVPLSDTSLPVGIGRAYVIHMVYRITGLAPGAHTLQVTIDTMFNAESRFYVNGWAREAPTAPQVWCDIPLTPSMDATLKLVAEAFNIWANEIVAEFDDVYVCSLYDIMSPGGVVDNSLSLDNVHPSWKACQEIAVGLDETIQMIPDEELAAT